jgi:hypothetical protein
LQNDVRPELIQTIKNLGIDTSKVKVLKATEQQALSKAQALFKKAHNVISATNAFKTCRRGRVEDPIMMREVK